MAAAAGGIAASVRATVAATDDALITGALGRLACALAHGTTTMEAKTGYALEPEGELRLLGLYATLSGRQPITLSPSLLAHGVPDGADRAAFVAAWVAALPRARGRA